MRILVDIRHLGQPHPSGVGEYTIELLRALFEMDKNNAYVLLSSGRQGAKSHATNAVTRMTTHHSKVQHIHIPIANKILNLKLLSGRIPSINTLAGGSYHLLFLPNLNITRIPANLPTVLTVHDLSWKFFPQFFSRRMLAWHAATKPEQLITRADRILTPSESTKRDIQSLYQKPDAQITVVPHGHAPHFSAHIQPQDHGVRSKYKLPKRFALFMGTLEPRKNIPMIIEGLEEYRARTGDDLHLVLAGKWGWRSGDIRLSLREARRKTWIHHLGYVEDQDRPALYRSASVFLWPSIYEGFGLPVLESMASGTPVITSHTSSLPELTESAAILIDPYNAHDLSDALGQLLSSEALRIRLSEAGIRRASAFTWNAAATRTLEAFTRATNPSS